MVLMILINITIITDSISLIRILLFQGFDCLEMRLLFDIRDIGNIINTMILVMPSARPFLPIYVLGCRIESFLTLVVRIE